MRLKNLIVLIAVFTYRSAALAQPPIDAPRPSPPYGASVTLAQARHVVAAAEAEAARLGRTTMTLAIEGPTGALILFEKMDDATYVAVEMAEAKAHTAAVSRLATGPFPPGVSPPMPDLVGLPGGVPLVVGGRTIGAIGIGGVDGADAQIAETAAKALN